MRKYLISIIFNNKTNKSFRNITFNLERKMMDQIGVNKNVINQIYQSIQFPLKNTETFSRLVFHLK